jgi:hypothetical protein
MNRKPILLVAVFAAALLWPSLADAQIAPRGFAVGVLGGFESWSLEADEREYGPAVEGFGRYTLDSGLQLAAGVTYSSMSVDAVPDNRQVWDIWGEVRVMLTNWNAASAYIGMRGGFVRQSLSTTINTQPTDISANGWMGRHRSASWYSSHGRSPWTPLGSLASQEPAISRPTASRSTGL